MIQLDLFAPPPPAPKPPCGLTERILSTGLEHNTFLLELNRTLGGWGTSPLPSRLFQFPIEYIGRSRIDADESLVALNHPLIGEHPFVKLAEERLGIRIPYLEHDEFGRDRGAKWRAFHAGDLATDKHFEALIETIRFTDLDGVTHGVEINLRHRGQGNYRGGLSTVNARLILSAIGAEEPEDRSAAALDAGCISPDPMFLSDSGKPCKMPRWGMNSGSRCSLDVMWAMLHGLEDGFFCHTKSGFLSMTDKGCERLGYRPTGERVQ